MNELKFIDLCCGIGGFHQALANMGMTCVMASDIDAKCRDNYKLNYGITPKGDLTEIEVSSIPSFDVLCAGFPCQPFSKAGQRNGFDDNRGNIFFDICNILDHHKPKYILLENVRNLSSHDDGNTWTTIKSKLDDLGYHTYEKPVILNALYFGVPQSRERVVIMCKRKDLGELNSLPSISRERVRETSIEDIVETECDPKYNIKGKMKETQIVWSDFILVLRGGGVSIPRFPIWTDWWDSDGENTTVTKPKKNLTNEENVEYISKSQSAFYLKYKNWIDKNREFYKTNISVLGPWLERSRKNKLWVGAVRKMEWQTGSDDLDMSQVLWSPRGSGVRIKGLNYAPTLVAMASMIPVYGPRNRTLSPRECARLQSFPENFIIHGDDKVSYKQFGNAVNVKMIERSARFLINNDPLFD
jgi:DNA (cytosine-5)-methyltransferase 1